MSGSVADLSVESTPRPEYDPRWSLVSAIPDVIDDPYRDRPNRATMLIFSARTTSHFLDPTGSISRVRSRATDRYASGCS
jgi:hypothetical protein